VERVFPKLVTSRPFDNAEDPAAILHDRVDRWTQTAGSKQTAETSLIAGLIPRAVGITDPDMALALDERDLAMRNRALELAVRAIEGCETWIRRLGTLPTDPAAREMWMTAASTVAVYRDRWKALAQGEVERTVAAMAGEIGAELTATLLGLDAAHVRILVKARKRPAT
jgi:hypothetical protein